MCASDMTWLVIRPCERGPRWTAHRGVGGCMTIVRPPERLAGDRKARRGSWPSRDAAIRGATAALLALRAEAPCTDRLARRDDDWISIIVQEHIGTTWTDATERVYVCGPPDPRCTDPAHEDCRECPEMAIECGLWQHHLHTKAAA